MAYNNNEVNTSDDFSLSIDPSDINFGESAFESIDEFKPKVYTKELGFGKRRSFLCFSKSNNFLCFNTKVFGI